MADWYVGQKVVCVNADIGRGRFFSPPPVERRIYTIREIFAFGDRVGLALEEIVGEMWNEMFEHSLDARRFRPVVLSESDISIFTEILDRVNKRGKVDA